MTSSRRTFLGLTFSLPFFGEHVRQAVKTNGLGKFLSPLGAVGSRNQDDDGDEGDVVMGKDDPWQTPTQSFWDYAKQDEFFGAVQDRFRTRTKEIREITDTQINGYDMDLLVLRSLSPSYRLRRQITRNRERTMELNQLRGFRNTTEGKLRAAWQLLTNKETEAEMRASAHRRKS